MKIDAAEILDVKRIRSRTAVNDAASDVEFLRNQRVYAGASEIDFASRWFLTKEIWQLGNRRCRVAIKAEGSVNRAVIAKTAEALNEGPVKWSNFAIRSDAEIIRPRFQVRGQPKLISTIVIGRKGRAARSLAFAQPAAAAE